MPAQTKQEKRELEAQLKAVDVKNINVANKKRHKTRGSEVDALVKDLPPRPGNKAIVFGALRFPSSKNVPAKYIAIPNEYGEPSLKPMANFLIKDPWNLGPPSVIISVTGGTHGAPRGASGSHDRVRRRGPHSDLQPR